MWRVMESRTAQYCHPPTCSEPTNNQRLPPLANGRGKIGKIGGITYVIAALDNHSRSLGVQQQACAALWNLSASGTPKWDCGRMTFTYRSTTKRTEQTEDRRAKRYSEDLGSNGETFYGGKDSSSSVRGAAHLCHR